MNKFPFVNYKYRSGAAALRNLSEGTAYFASPAELNDALEAKFELADTTSFIEIMTNTLNELESLRGRVGKYKFNKTGFIEFDKENSFENQRFYKNCQETGIFSTASRPDNQPMWAYYCNDSKGVCFELEWSKEVMQKHGLWPIEVNYSNKSRLHNRADDMRQALLELGEEHPDWNLQQLKEFSLSEPFRRRWGIRSIARAVSVKHLDWQHESELRVISSRSGALPIISDVLKRVIFTRTDFTEWGAIMMLLHRLYPKVEIARVEFAHKEPFSSIVPLEMKKIPIEYGYKNEMPYE